MIRGSCKLFTISIFFLLALAGSSWAATTGMPWEGPMTAILNSATGTVARVIGTLCVFGFGIGVAFSGEGTGMRKALWVCLGLAIAFAAGSWGLPFLGFGGGLVIL